LRHPKFALYKKNLIPQADYPPTVSWDNIWSDTTSYSCLEYA
jgi:hypothetical protein